MSLDPRTLDIATGKRRLQSIEDDGTLIYDEPCVLGSMALLGVDLQERPRISSD